MKKISVFFAAMFLVFAAGARYDAFMSEAKNGLDYVEAQSRGDAAEGELGRQIYSEKVKADYDIFIPTDNYVRLGAIANLGFASTMDYELGLGGQFGFGWNFSSFIRGEFGWGHSSMRFDGDRRTVPDSGRLTLWFDLARRNVMRGDIIYRRRIVPFIGIGGIAGYARFDNTAAALGHGNAAFGPHAALGLSFVFSDTNAIDLAVGYDLMYGKEFGWENDSTDRFGNAGISLSWRSGF